MLRLFVGLLLPRPIASHLAAHAAVLGPTAGFRLTPVESLHLTLRFLGEVDEKNVASIHTDLEAAARAHTGFDIHLKSGGTFPEGGNPSTFWTGIGGDTQALAALAAAIGNSNFKPHVTVARANDDAANLSGAREQFGTLFSPYKSPDFPVREFHLIHSKLYPSGPHYKSIALFPLRPI